MAVTPMSDNLNIIAALADEPNATSGLTAAQFKAKFDEGSGLIKTYINATLVPVINTAVDGLGKITTKSSNATLTTAEIGIVEVTAATDLTITLPSAATLGLRYVIKKVDGGTGKVTVATTSSQTIDGATTQVIYNRYDQVTLVSNGASWDIVGRMNKGEAWIAPTLQNSWLNFGGGIAPAGYYKDAMGIVHIRGGIKSGTTSPLTTILTLPVGYRPAFKQSFVVNCNGSAGTVSVDNAGLLQIDTVASNAILWLDSISFRAEA